MKRGKIVSIDDAVRVIRVGDTAAMDVILGACVAEQLIAAANKYIVNGIGK